jgi:mono/diheme cytochrome c family protein
MKPVSTLISLAIVIGGITLAGCAETFAPAPALPTTTALPKSAANLAIPDLARGQQVYLDKQCVACHSSQGEGGVGPQLAGPTLPFDQFLHKVRTALPPKPAFNDAELTTQDVHNIYGWLQSLEQTGTSAAVAAPLLPSGQVLGMKVWTEGKCDTCHGAFAQGSPNGPTLAGLSFPFELERAKMRQTADTIPEHSTEHMDDALFQRLYRWLQAGANPDDGC